MATVVITDISESGGAITATAEVTATGFGTTNYTLNINDSQTGVSEDFSDTIAPGVAIKHSISFTPGEEFSQSVITAQFTSPDDLVGEQDQQQYSYVDRTAVDVVDCELRGVGGTLDPGDTYDVDVTLVNNNVATLNVDLVLTIDGGAGGNFGETTTQLFGGQEATVTFTGDTGGRENATIPLRIGIQGVEQP